VEKFSFFKSKPRKFTNTVETNKENLYKKFEKKLLNKHKVKTLENNDDKLVVFIGLMVSLVQQDDNFCKQEQIYIDKFVDNLSENKKTEMIEKLGNKQLDGLVEELNKLSDDDQFEILNKLIELAAIDNKIDGKEAYLICYLAKTINLDADKIVDYMQEAYSFEPKLLEDEILRMDNEIDDVGDENNDKKTVNQHSSTVIGYRRHSKI
jgi:uncharacterized tellurite resistance protein B-like protein